jgi:hypothetical protein
MHVSRWGARLFWLLHLLWDGEFMSNREHGNLWEQYDWAAARAYREGNVNKAARIIKVALRECEDYAELHSGLIDRAHQIADEFMTQCRYTEAESLFRAVLEIREKLLGQTHQDVIESLKKVTIVQILSFRAEALGHNVVHAPQSWSVDQVAVAS